MIRLTIPDFTEDDFTEVKSVLESGFLVQGEKVKQFESMVCSYLGSKYAIAVSSGTAALHLSLLALGVGKLDEVIVPDFTFPATSNVVELVGATTKFVDINLDSYCMDSSKLESIITNRTKVIMPVHQFGQAANMDEILALAKKYSLHVVEDAACAFGARYNGKMVGTLGDIGCFSFHPRKSITTGEGGVIVTDNDLLANKLRLLRNHGMDLSGKKPSFVVPGYNYRLTEIQGALGIAQMKRLSEIYNNRSEMARYYNEQLKNIKQVKLPIQLDYGKHIYQTYYILLDQSINRDKLIEYFKENGVETNIGAYSVHLQPYYESKYNYSSIDLKNSISAYKYGIALPLHSKLKKSDVDKIVEILKSYLYV